jgi:hypothetical protein
MPTHIVPLSVILLLDAVAIVLAVRAGQPPDQFFKEYAAMTYLSGLQLLAISFVCWRIFRPRRSPSRHRGLRDPSWLWAMIALGFLFFACDEVLRIHERLDHAMHFILDIQETALTDRLDDLIVAGYGACLLGVFYVYRGELQHYREMLPWLAVALLGLVGTVTLDILTNRDDMLSSFISNPGRVELVMMQLNVVEDSMKILAEGILLGAFAGCLRIARQRSAAAVEL